MLRALGTVGRLRGIAAPQLRALTVKTPFEPFVRKRGAADKLRDATADLGASKRVSPPCDESAPRKPVAGVKARALNKRLLDGTTDVLAMFEESGEYFNEVNVATAIHQLAKRRDQRTRGDPRLGLLFETAASRVVDESPFGARELANMAWSVAKLRPPPSCAWRGLLDAIAVAAPLKIDEFDPQNLTITAWAYATTGVRPPALFDAIACAAPRKIDEFTPQALANMAWAFAKAGVAAPALFGAIAVAAPRTIDKFKPQHLANTAWAFATARVAAPALFGAIAREAARKLPEFNKQELGMMKLAFVKARVPAPALLVAIDVAMKG